MPPRLAPARCAAALLAGLALAVPAAGAAAEIEVTWDPDLAFEWDRASYEKTLLGLVRTAEAEVTGWLGWPLRRPLQLRVVTRVRYEAQFGADAVWRYGAHYDRGVVHVNGGARLNGFFAGLLTHELTHAWLDDRGSAERLPTWLNEGLAERLAFKARGQQALDSTQRQQLEVALEQRTLVPLQDGGTMTTFRYLQGFAVVLFLEQRVGKEKLLALVRRTLERDAFERALDAELRWTRPQLEAEFAAWVDHLQ